VELIINDIELGYRELLRRIIEQGRWVAPRGQQTLALRNVTLVHRAPGDCLLVGVGRGLSTGLAALESLQLVGGFSDPKLTVQIAPNYAKFLDGEGFHGAYGSRTGRKVAHVLDRLRKDESSRQAMMTFWEDDQDLAVDGMHDYPCTVSSHYEINQGALYGTTVMRSNDAWLGYPYDVMQHTSLLRSMAQFLHLEVGTYTHIVHNMHLYNRDLDRVTELLNRPPGVTKRPRLMGGIGRGDEMQWHQVQQRAHAICYGGPGFGLPSTLEEEWMGRTAETWRK